MVTYATVCGLAPMLAVSVFAAAGSPNSAAVSASE